MKRKLLVVDLADPDSKLLGEVITNSTSRKILSHLLGKEDTKANMSRVFGTSVSTITYHIRKLEKAGLVVSETFHYSKKGNVVDRYKLADRYVVFTPTKTTELKERLKDILPAGLIAAGVGVGVDLLEMIFFEAGGGFSSHLSVKWYGTSSGMFFGIFITVVVYVLWAVMKRYFQKIR